MNCHPSKGSITKIGPLEPWLWAFEIWYYFGQKSENVVKEILMQAKFYQNYILYFDFHIGNINVDLGVQNYLFLTIFTDFTEWYGISLPDHTHSLSCLHFLKYIFVISLFHYGNLLFNIFIWDFIYKIWITWR